MAESDPLIGSSCFGSVPENSCGTAPSGFLCGGCFFDWLNESLMYDGGRSFAGYIRSIRADAIEHLATEETAAVSELLKDSGTIDLSALPVPKGPPGTWTVDSTMELFGAEFRGRDFENGKNMYSAGRCVAYHRFGGNGMIAEMNAEELNDLIAYLVSHGNSDHEAFAKP